MVVDGRQGPRGQSQRQTRRKLHYPANIYTDEDPSPIPCMIADISATGARIVVVEDRKMPERFLLLLTENGAARRNCHLVWQDERTLGVRFVAA